MRKNYYDEMLFQERKCPSSLYYQNSQLLPRRWFLFCKCRFDCYLFVVKNKILVLTNVWCKKKHLKTIVNKFNYCNNLLGLFILPWLKRMLVTSKITFKWAICEMVKNLGPEKNLVKGLKTCANKIFVQNENPCFWWVHKLNRYYIIT